MKTAPILFALALGPMAANATPASPLTPSPVIFLSDNLDEPAKRGFCLDTKGRGISDRMHIHTCKTEGGDVQFRFDNEGHLRSVAFPNLCAEITSTDPATADFLLNTCSNAASQQFNYDASTSRIHPRQDTSLCLAAGRSTRVNPPFAAHALVLADCGSTPTKNTSWTVRE